MTYRPTTSANVLKRSQDTLRQTIKQYRDTYGNPAEPPIEATIKTFEQQLANLESLDGVHNLTRQTYERYRRELSLDDDE